MIKIIKNEKEYEQALKRAEELVGIDPPSGTPESDELELLTLLIEKYEDERYPIEMPDPISAIRFRMEQQGLAQKDLASYIGSPSKVSEVLNGKRPLTLNMIRALHKGLGIPAEILLQEKDDAPLEDETGLDWSKFPIADLIKRGWIKFDGTLAQAKENAEELVRSFFKGVPIQNLLGARCRQNIRSGKKLDEYALMAWKAQVLKIAAFKPVSAYKKGVVSQKFISEVVRLSYLEEGPRLVNEYLGKNGIHFVILKHLQGTHLDGAAFLNENGAPIIALTLRYERIDNFWFTLAHELAHIKLHLGKENIDCFIDDDFNVEGDAKEIQADMMAREAIIPGKIWGRISKNLSNDNIFERADELRLHPAILAGRLRWEQNNYKLFAKSVPNTLDTSRL